MMSLFWTPEALQDREDVYTSIETNNPAAALAFDELLEKKAERLLDHPGLGRPGRVAATRELMLHPNYVLVYDLPKGANAVRVLRLLHAARKWPPF